MKSVRVQFVLTESEYEELKRQAGNISISKYIKDRVFPKEDSFAVIWEEFTEKLARFPVGKEFSVVDVMTAERWNTLDKSSKLSLGRLLNKKVKTGEFSDIALTRRSSANVSLYIKKA